MLASVSSSSMTPALTCLFAGLVASVFIIFIYRMLRRTSPTESEIEWLHEFSIESYQPMARLLDENDYEFLARQPGYDASISQELRAERRRIFRCYLHSLVRDFNALIRLAKFVLVSSPEDRPGLAGDIVRMQIRFYCAVGAAELRLALAPLPVGGINVSGLLESLAAVHNNLGKAAARVIPA